MKHLYILSLLIILSVFNASAQRSMRNLPDYNNKLCHFGFSVGINSMTFGVTQSDDFFERADIYGVEAKKYVGFHVGPVANLRLNRYLISEFCSIFRSTSATLNIIIIQLPNNQQFLPKL